MSLLLAGMLVWIVAHSFKATAPARRDALVAKFGEQPWRGVFSLVILASLLMIVFGWKAAVPGAVYAPPLAPGIIPSLLVLIGLVLFFAAQMNGNIKRILRHPQMAGTIVWAVAHLLTIAARDPGERCRRHRSSSISSLSPLASWPSPLSGTSICSCSASRRFPCRHRNKRWLQELI